MVLFVHATSSKYIKQIIEDNELRSYSKTKNPGIGEGENLMNPESIFLTVLFDYYKIAIPDYIEEVFLFFDQSILEKNTCSHYCNVWEWGRITKNCIPFDSTKSIDDTIVEWGNAYKESRNIFKNPQNFIYGPLDHFSGVINEVIFNGSVRFDSLVGIYCNHAKWKHPLLMTTQTELKHFLNKYGYMDVDSDPKMNYYIEFSINWNENTHNAVEKKWLNWARSQTYHSPEWRKWKSRFKGGKTRNYKRKQKNRTYRRKRNA